MAKIDLQKYHTAVMQVKSWCGSSTPIKKTDFIEKNQLAPLFFRTMEDLNIIKEHSSNNLTGTVYSWIYKQASNEADSHVTVVLTEKIQEINRAVYKKYSGPGHIPKKRKPVITSAISRSRKPKPEIYSGPSITVREGVPEIVDIPSVETPISDFVGTPEIHKPEVFKKSKKQSNPSKVSFNFEGEYSKEEMVAKVMALIDNKEITSFQLSVTYN